MAGASSGDGAPTRSRSQQDADFAEFLSEAVLAIGAKSYDELFDLTYSQLEMLVRQKRKEQHRQELSTFFAFNQAYTAARGNSAANEYVQQLKDAINPPPPPTLEELEAIMLRAGCKKN